MTNLGALVSRNARWLNRHIFSNQIEPLSQKKYMEFLSLNQMKRYFISGLIDAFTSEKIEFDSNDNISNLKGNLTLAASKKLRFGITNPTFSNGKFVNAQNTSVFPVELRPGVVIPGYFGDGIVSLEENDILKLSGMKGREHQIFLDLVVDFDGNIISHRETTFKDTSFSLEMRDQFNQLFACLKPLAREGKVQVVESFIEKAKKTIYPENLSALTTLVNDCKQNTSTSLISEISEESKTIQEWLSNSKHHGKDLLACTGKSISANAAVMVNFKVGAGFLVCTFQDGTRRTYAGMQQGIGWGIGVQVATEDTIVLDDQKKQPTKINSMFLAAGEKMETDASGLNTYYWNELSDGKVRGLQGRERTLGLHLGFGASSHLMVRVGKKKDDYTFHLNYLSKSILVTVVR